MKIKDIRQKAREMGIPSDDMPHVDVVRSIQRAEGNAACYDTGRAVECGQHHCLWKYICH